MSIVAMLVVAHTVVIALGIELKILFNTNRTKT